MATKLVDGGRRQVEVPDEDLSPGVTAAAQHFVDNVRSMPGIDSITLSTGDGSPPVTIDTRRPVAPFAIPGESAFGGRDFLPAPTLQRIADDLVARCPEFDFIATNDWTVKVLWKRKGGHSFGHNTLLKGLARHFAAGTTWTIEIAADNCDAYQFTERQMEALVYHELCHCDFEVKEDKETGERLFRATARRHDVELFSAEVRRYGAWRSELAAVERAYETYRQETLPGFGES